MNNVSQYYSRFYHQYKQHHIVKVLPGGVYSTNEPEMISTGLGSCVAACMWDPIKGVGGMNHFLLPSDERAYSKGQTGVITCETRYGPHAMELLISQLLAKGASRSHLQMKVFGGAQMLGKQSAIGEKNAHFILHYAKQENLQVASYDLGGVEPRRILFDPMSGRVLLKRIPFAEVDQLEANYASQLKRSAQFDAPDEMELFELCEK